MNRSEEIYNNYDTIIIFKPTLSDSEYDDIILHYSDLLNKLGCTNFEVHNMGKKKLAYSIKNYEYGYYIQFSHTAPSGAIVSLEKNLRADPDVIKHISVMTEREVEVLESESKSEQNSKDKNKNIDAMDVLLGLAKYN